MRCIVAMFQHETNTFSPIATPLSAFGSGVGLVVPPTGDQAVEMYGNADFAFAAMLQQAQANADEVVVPIAAYAEPSGKVDDQAFESICDAICIAVRQGCDAVLLDLHGAMVTQSFDDGEGELLRRIRAIDSRVPIAVALDFTLMSQRLWCVIAQLSMAIEPILTLTCLTQVDGLQRRFF